MKKTLRQLRQLRRKLRRKLRQRKEGHLTKGESARNLRQTSYIKRMIVRLRERRTRLELSHRQGIDWAYGTPRTDALLEAEKTFVCRYLSHDPAKNLDREEAIGYSRAGIDLVVVWEGDHEAPKKGFNQGRKDAKEAQTQARALGKPPLVPIFFAIDYDAAGPDVQPYFEGIVDVLGKDLVGIYGGLDVVEYMLDHKVVRWAWQTYAWSNHVWDQRARLRQVLITLPGAELHLDGVSVDYCKSVHEDFGQWKSTLA